MQCALLVAMLVDFQQHCDCIDSKRSYESCFSFVCKPILFGELYLFNKKNGISVRAHYFLKLHPVSCTVPLSIIYPQSFISIPLARDYNDYYDYYYSYYVEYSRSQWISRLQFYWNFELTPRVRSENEVDLTCL